MGEVGSVSSGFCCQDTSSPNGVKLSDKTNQVQRERRAFLFVLFLVSNSVRNFAVIMLIRHWMDPVGVDSWR